jgi:phosphoglycerate kinase
VQLEEIIDKKVLIRLDYNVPIEDGIIVNDFRIRQTYDTLNSLLDHNNKLIIASHLGRPTEGSYDESLSLKPICEHLSSKLNKKIQFIKSINDKIDFTDYDIAMLENVRFNIGEKKCDPKLSQTIASLADIFVFDAFGVSHRSECTTTGVTNYLQTVAGLNIRYEIETINKLINDKSRPMTIIISGAKVSTKIVLIKKLLSKCDHMILGGGILNTFLKAKGCEVGNSLLEEEFVSDAAKILESDFADKIIFPSDFTCETADGIANVELSRISSNDTIYDLGSDSINEIKNIVRKSVSVFWNGPLGYVEKEPFNKGTEELAKVIADHNCFSIVGGGDTLPIIENLKLQNDYSCLSTGGGSLLTYLEGGSLPIIDKLNLR